MMPENLSSKIPVLLMHYPEDENWSAEAIPLEYCISEGPTPEMAITALICEINFFLERDPRLIEILNKPPEVLLTEINLPSQTSQNNSTLTQ